MTLLSPLVNRSVSFTTMVGGWWFVVGGRWPNLQSVLRPPSSIPPSPFAPFALSAIFAVSPPVFPFSANFFPLWQYFRPLWAIFGRFYSILAVFGGFLVPRKPWRRGIDPSRLPTFRFFSDFRSLIGLPHFQPPHPPTGPFFADFSLFSAFSGHFSPDFRPEWPHMKKCFPGSLPLQTRVFGTYAFALALFMISQTTSANCLAK